MEKQGTAEDIKKVIAFQLGQILGLLEGREFYTKSSISKYYPSLKPYLYREVNSDILDLQVLKNRLVEKLVKFKIEEGTQKDDIMNHTVKFLDYNVAYELKHETKIINF